MRVPQRVHFSVERLSSSEQILHPAAVKLMRTRIRLLAQSKSMRSLIDATQREQRHGLP